MRRTPSRSSRPSASVGFVLLLLFSLAGALPAPALEAAGEPFRLDEESCTAHSLDVERLADGGVVATWVQLVGSDFGPVPKVGVHARRFDADGTPREPVILVDVDDDLVVPFGAGGAYEHPTVAGGADGGFLVGWVRPGTFLEPSGFPIRARPYGPDGTPLREAIESGPSAAGLGSQVDAVATADGYRLFWLDVGSEISSRVIDLAGDPGEPEVVSSWGTIPENTLLFNGVRAASDPAGFSLIIEADVSGPFGPDGPLLLGQRFPAGTPFPEAPVLPLETTEPPADLDADGSAVGTDGAGNTVVAWRVSEGFAMPVGIRVQRFAADGAKLGEPVWVTGPGGWDALSGAAVAVAVDGSFRVAWAGRAAGAPGDALYVADFDADGNLLATLGPLHAGTTLIPDPGPIPAPELVDLGGGASLLAWQGFPPPGAPGLPPCFSTGLHAQRIESDKEALPLHHGRFSVRVDWRDPYAAEERTGSGIARPLNDESGWFWFFRDGNAELVVKILDGRLVNGHWWVFHGGLSTVEYEITVTDRDTGATWSYDKPPFQRISAADTMAFPDSLAAAAAARPAGATAVTAGTHPESAAGPCTDPSLPIPIRPGLCLHDRFEVEVELDDPLFHHGHGAAPLSDDTGRFWFFRQANTELLVKVLDGRPVNGHWWFFSGALSNVGYTLVVRDLEDGTERRYPVPEGRFESIADTTLFADTNTSP